MCPPERALNPSPSEVDTSLSAVIAQAIIAKPKACWINAWRGLAEFWRYPGVAYYVEGWAVTSFNVPIEHGWIEWNHRIVDPALYESSCIAFFPVVRWTLEQAQEQAEEVNGYLPVTRHKSQVAKYEHVYRTAMQEALDFCQHRSA